MTSGKRPGRSREKVVNKRASSEPEEIFEIPEELQVPEEEEVEIFFDSEIEFGD